jgi:hypothetical protein
LGTIAFLKLNSVKEERFLFLFPSLMCSLELLTSAAIAGGKGA